ncbi:hypothetical protein ABPG77_007794 [Micractinium sp. CCAP 211/92]
MRACAVLLLLAAAAAVAAAAKPSAKLSLPGSKSPIVFALIGGGLEQLKVAELMNMACAKRGCQFVVNTGENVYNARDMHALRGLPWINSLGNHDVLGLKGGVDEQIAYQQKNKNWILPGRWFNTDVSGASTSIRFHVAHTSCWVKKYRVPGNDYYNNELTYCSSNSSVAKQLSFLEFSMNSSSADWNIVIAHHPAVSTAGPSYFDPSQKPDTGADGWGPFADLVAKYKPEAYFNGHDHAMSFQYAPEPVTTGDTTLATGFPNTGFHTSGAGSWPQASAAADGGFGLNPPYSFTKYSNVDWLKGLARSGFAIVTVDKKEMVIDYYSVDNGLTVPFRVTTKKGQPPIWQFSPEGLRLTKLPNTIQMNQDGEYVQFRRKI